MAKNKSSKRLSWQLCKPVIASALAIGGVFNLVGLVLADGTAAGTQITNTATATYRDPDGTPQTATSNPVVVEVAEIAGITVTHTKVTEVTDPADGDPPGPGDLMEFVFDITNVGNDETDISLPAIANFTGPVDSVTKIELLDPTDPENGPRTAITSRTDFENLDSGDKIQVAVTVLVSTSAQNDDIITVQYGDTPGNGQNQPYDSSGGSVFTDDNDATDVANNTQTTAEAGPEAPANGEREASDTGEVTIGKEPLEQPLVELKKTIDNHTENTANDPTDDNLTYNLTFDVLNTLPADLAVNSDAVPADLEAISISVDGTPSRRVLVSDAIPEGTSYVSAQAPSGGTAGGTTWTLVYTESLITTTSATAAAWQTGTPTPAATRVGFISDANATITKGTSVSGFQITVLTDGVDPTDSPISIANIAQVFGSGTVDDPLTPDDETLTFPVMDESGDTTPSNYDPNTDTYSNFNPDIVNDNPPTETPDGFTPGDGYISDPSDLLTQGVDPGGNTPANDTDDNGGDNTDGDGEAIVVILVAEPDPNILNGPEGEPDAIGPTGTNDDFTNKSTPYADGNPPFVSFTNTVQNNDTNPDPLINTSEDGWVRLEPIAPDNPNALPKDTKATLIDRDGNRVEYIYDPAGNGGQGAWTKTTPTDPDIILSIRKDDGVDGSGEDQFDYGVEVKLPDGSPDIQELDSFPVPIEATLAGLTAVGIEDVNNGNNDGNLDDAEIAAALDASTLKNVTIDRVYTGFLELVKTAQVVRGDGPEVSGNPAPGNHVRYRVTYQNISETQTGSMQGNRLLTASDLAIIEDGTELACANETLITDGNGNVIGGPNNWAVDNDNGDGDTDFGTDLDTRHVLSSVDLTNLDSGSTGSVLFYSGGPECDGNGKAAFNPDIITPATELSGTTYNTDTTKYVFDIDGDILPLESGYVEFERRIN